MEYFIFFIIYSRTAFFLTLYSIATLFAYQYNLEISIFLPEILFSVVIALLFSFLNKNSFNRLEYSFELACSRILTLLFASAAEEFFLDLRYTLLYKNHFYI
jgi:hypothetical protein